MLAKKIVPILLVAGAVHMMMKHSQRRCDEQRGDKPATEGEHAHDPQFRRGPFAQHGDWQKHVLPMFEMLHTRTHAAQDAAPNVGQSAAQNPPQSATPAV